MSSTVFMLVAFVFLVRFDSGYKTKEDGGIAGIIMVVATIIAVIWDVAHWA